MRPKLFSLLAATGVVATLASGSIALAADPPYTGPATKTITAPLVDGTGATIGSVQLSQNATGVVQLTVSGSGLGAGEHGIHIHAVGKCEGPGFTTAGGHFNVTSHQHGLDNPAGPHDGDLTGLTVAANGTYTYTSTTNRVSLTSGASNIFDADGTALVIHADKDDQVTDPTGNSGARVACAVLAVAQPAPAVTATATKPAAPAPPNTGTGLATDGGSPFVVGAGIALVLSALALGATRVTRRRS